MEALSPRASSLLKTLVDMHIREGQPIASKNLQGESGLSVSSATVRSIMSELEDLGYLASPHTSAGRVPCRPTSPPWLSLQGDSMYGSPVEKTSRSLERSRNRSMDEVLVIPRSFCGLSVIESA